MSSLRIVARNLNGVVHAVPFTDDVKIHSGATIPNSLREYYLPAKLMPAFEYDKSGGVNEEGKAIVATLGEDESISTLVANETLLLNMSVAELFNKISTARLCGNVSLDLTKDSGPDFIVEKIKRLKKPAAFTELGNP